MLMMRPELTPCLVKRVLGLDWLRAVYPMPKEVNKLAQAHDRKGFCRYLVKDKR